MICTKPWMWEQNENLPICSITCIIRTCPTQRGSIPGMVVPVSFMVHRTSIIACLSILFPVVSPPSGQCLFLRVRLLFGPPSAVCILETTPISSYFLSPSGEIHSLQLLFLWHFRVSFFCFHNLLIVLLLYNHFFCNKLFFVKINPLAQRSFIV